MAVPCGDLLTAALKNNKQRLALAYTLTIAGGLSGQLYPLATALAINGVLQQDYHAILWLVACHFTTLVLEVSAKMVDTRAFTKVYTDIAEYLAARSFQMNVDPAIIASRIALSREYVTFLERDVPTLLTTVVALTVSVSALLWLDPFVAVTSLLLVIPLGFVSRWLAKRSYKINVRLNHRLERETILLKTSRMSSIVRHFRVLASWRVRLSDAEARAYFKMDLAVIALFSIALARLGSGTLVEAGSIYAVFSYIWKYVLALDGIPVLIQQLSKLKDLNGRLIDI